MPHMTTYGAEVDWKWTRLSFRASDRPKHFPIYFMRGIYKHRALAPCNFFIQETGIQQLSAHMHTVSCIEYVWFEEQDNIDNPV